MRLKSQKGGAAVEFAIIAPLLFVILFGIIEFSILLYDKAMLTNASREGARAGIVFVDTRVPDDINNNIIVPTVKNYCEDYLISFKPEDLGVDVDWTDGTTSGKDLKVTVTYKFDFLVFSKIIKLIGGNFADILDLQAVTVMRLE